MFNSNLAAINAARKTYGKDYAQFVTIEKLAVREWTVQVKQVIDRSTAWECCATPVEGVFHFPYAVDFPTDAQRAAADEAEYQAQNMAAFFKSRSLNSEVESEDESDASPESDIDLAQTLADKAANNAAMQQRTDGEYLRDFGKCPKCGSEEIFLGYSDHGLVVDDDRVGGCHACDFQFDERKKVSKPWVHQSTVDKPVKRVWAIADECIRAAAEAGLPRPSRKEIQEVCVKMGIASGTARTQYQAWKKANDNARANEAAAKAASDRFNGK